MLLKFAWRNIWRNKRRTLITAASIFTAVILALLMRSVQIGAYQRMIDNVVSFYSGHIQLHAAGYWDEKTLDHTFVANDSIETLLNHQREIVSWVPRLESFALTSAKELTQGSLVVGIDPNAEDKLTHLSQKVIAGEYLEEKDSGILVAEGLAEKIQLGVGDTIVLLGQGYHGVTAAGKYEVKGIVHFSAPNLNDGMVYLTIPVAQVLFGTGERLTSIAISIEQNADATQVATVLRQRIGSMPFEFYDWKQMMPEMVQLIEVDSAGGIIVIAILYMIIAFGIFGTIVMMLAERQHEFGILVAIGMKKMKLATVVVIEILMIALLGTLAGILAGIPIIAYFHANPISVTGEMAKAYESFGMEAIFPFSKDINIFITQATIVFVLSLVLSIYPWFRILRLKAIEALKS